MAEFLMPSLGADMESGTVLEWLVKPGDVVRKGDIVAVVDTDKSAIDVECFTSGVVDRLLVKAGEKVSVGTPLALIDGADRPVPAATPEPAAAPAPAPAPAPPAGGQPARHPLSPIVRKRAAEAGVDLAAVVGSGPGGTVTRTDVEKAVATATAPPSRRSGQRTRKGGRRAVTPPSSPTPTARPRISPYARRLARERGIDPATLHGSGTNGVVHARDVPEAPTAPTTRPTTTGPTTTGDPARRATAALMAKANREIPHYYLALDIDLSVALDWLRGHNRTVPVPERVLPAAVLLRSVVLAAQAVPQLNGHWVEDRFAPGSGVHLGIAVSLRSGGLVVPVIHDAQALPLDGLMARMRETAERARSGRLRSSEAGGATLTVTNLGELGTDRVDGVIHPPQVALVGFGAVRRRPWADGDTVAVRPVVTATLAADHRATDGAVGARLLHAIEKRLNRPEEL